MVPVLLLLTGEGLFNALWGAVGTVIILGAVVMIIFKFFIGAQKNVGAGLAALAGVAVLTALAANPTWVVGAGTSLLKIIGIG